MRLQPSRLVLAASILLLVVSAGVSRLTPVEATHNEGWHVQNFHSCGPIVTYHDTAYGSVSQMNMDNIFNLAFESGYGWDSLCGNKLARTGGGANIDAFTGPNSWVAGYCGGGGDLAGCVVGHSRGGHEYYFWVFLVDSYFSSYGLSMSNHEVGHTFDMADHYDCDYPGVMGNCSWTSWPTIDELNSAANVLVWGP